MEAIGHEQYETSSKTFSCILKGTLYMQMVSRLSALL